MSESKMVTEREAVLRERRAFVRGAAFEDEAWRETMSVDHSSGADCIAEARTRYPLPKVQRSRILVDNEGTEWRVVDGRIEWRWNGSPLQWESLDDPDQYFALTTVRVKLLADLIDRPTELVEDGAP